MTNAFATRTIEGWFSGQYRFLSGSLPLPPSHPLASLGNKLDIIGTATSVAILTPLMEDYWNQIDKRLANRNDKYVTESFEEMRLQFGGSLPCVFLDLLASAVSSVATQIAVSRDPPLVITTREAHVADVTQRINTVWPAYQATTFLPQVLACQANCNRLANTTGGCCGQLRPGSAKRFQFGLEFKSSSSTTTTPPGSAAPIMVESKLTFAGAAPPSAAATSTAPTMLDKDHTTRLCDHCQAAGAKKLCSLCGVARYCDISCQRSAWESDHRSLCVKNKKT